MTRPPRKTSMAWPATRATFRCQPNRAPLCWRTGFDSPAVARSDSAHGREVGVRARLARVDFVIVVGRSHHAHRRLLGDRTPGSRLVLVDLALHRHDLAAERRELLVARGHRRCSAPQQGLHDELQNLDFAFGEAVADTHAAEPSKRSVARQWLTCHVSSHYVMSRFNFDPEVFVILRLFGST